MYLVNVFKWTKCDVANRWQQLTVRGRSMFSFLSVRSSHSPRVTGYNVAHETQTQTHSQTNTLTYTHNLAHANAHRRMLARPAPHHRAWVIFYVEPKRIVSVIDSYRVRAIYYVGFWPKPSPGEPCALWPLLSHSFTFITFNTL